MFSMSIVKPQNTVRVESFSTLAFSAVYTETMRFQKVAFSNNSTLKSVFKKLRFHSQIFRFHVDGKLKRKNKVACSFENVLV